MDGPDGTSTELEAPAVILATGSVPRTMPGFEVDGRFVMTSDEVLDLEQLPESAVVVGGGAIGCEFASMLSDMGVRVTILEALPKILPGVDKDVTDVVLRSFKRRGINVRTGVIVYRHTPERGRQAATAVEFETDGGTSTTGWSSCWRRCGGCSRIIGPGPTS